VTRRGRVKTIGPKPGGKLRPRTPAEGKGVTCVRKQWGIKRTKNLTSSQEGGRRSRGGYHQGEKGKGGHPRSLRACVVWSRKGDPGGRSAITNRGGGGASAVTLGAEEKTVGI